MSRRRNLRVTTGPLGNTLIAVEILRKLPRLLQAAFWLAALYVVLWIDAHWPLVLVLGILAGLAYTAWRVRFNRVWGSLNGWHYAREEQDVKDDETYWYELRHGHWEEAYDDGIPF